MGQTSQKHSDYSIITSDNCRNQPFTSIVSDILSCFKSADNQTYEVIEDRSEAIFKAVSIAKKDDIVLIAGKGHEKKMIAQGKTVEFDDCEQAKKAMARIKGGS